MGRGLSEISRGRETVTGTYRHVDDLWDDDQASQLDPLGRLVYRSNLLGSDGRITNTGGGNTSAKLRETDPLSGDPVDVLWVKGSGGDLRTATREHFASLYMDRLLALQSHYAHAPQRGPKTPIEDAIVGLYSHCTFNLNPRPSSIDTPLHGFVPYRQVDHTHPNAVIALAAAKNSERLTREIYGDEVVWTSWQRPGFDLGLKLADICRKHPHAKGVILGWHGLINWADDDKACYRLTLDLIERAARFIEARDRGAQTFGGPEYEPLAPSRRQALLVEILPWLRDPNPTVILIPGLGMIAWGKDKSESRVTAEFYNCAVEVMRGAEAIDQYTALPLQEAFDIEYWLLEEAKLKRMPPEKELARNIVIVIGAGSGIGKEVAHRLVKEGAHIVCVDLKAETAQATAQEITDRYGLGLGVAGSGISNCGPAIRLACDITKRASVRAMLDQGARAYGG